MTAAHDLKTIGLIDVLTSYKSICQEIEFYEILLLDAEIEYKRNRKVLIGGPKAKPTHLPMDRQLEGINQTLNKHNEIEHILNKKRELKKRAEQALEKFEGIEYKVAYKKYVEGKSLKETAFELGYAYGYVKNISKRITESLGEL
ncbi:MAG: hypothetical protein ACI35R_06445 [Bacillus sp. (in: firmicutes)]